MNKEFYLILLSVFLFVAVNTVFYFRIFNSQLDFQTELLARQTQICSNTIEREGLLFENELNSIPYEHDFTRLFTDDEIRQSGSVNLQKLYAGYSQLIDKITVYDNHNNVYSLILDSKNNFVSDFYESQRQIPLKERDDLIEKEGRYQLSIPGFDDDGIVRSNILVDLNYTRFIYAIFERYGLEHTLWQWLVSDEGELISEGEQYLVIPEADLNRIGKEIQDITEGYFIHTVSFDSITTRVISAYYPVRFVNRDFGVVFSIKTDLFLHSIVTKLIIISICSLLLLAVLLYIHFRVTKKGAVKITSQAFSEDSESKTIDVLPLGLIFLNTDGSIRSINHAGRQIFAREGVENATNISELGFEKTHISINGSLYQRMFGEGRLIILQRHALHRYIYLMEWETDIAGADTKMLLLIDVSEIENYQNLEKINELARTDLIHNMAKEIAIPLQQLQDIIPGLKNEDLNKPFELLSNLINATLDFAKQQTANAVKEEIPFFLRPEIELAFESFKGTNSSVSIITKIRNEVPDQLVGDPFRLRQALSNLIENAFENTEEGRILISCELLEKHPGLLKLQFNVEDTGKGLQDKQMEKLMDDLLKEKIDAHSESDRSVVRVGIARQHIELMKGRLWIESPSTISTSPDKPGIKYNFTIEVIPGENIKDNLVFTDVMRLENIGCLVVSQEKETENERFKQLLEMGLKLKFLVYREENTDALVELVKEKVPSMHMLIVQNSATQDGFEIAGKLIHEGISRDIILLMLSSYQKQENLTLSRSAGIDYYLEDPFEPSRITEILVKHFPDLDKEEIDRAPRHEKIDQKISVLLAEDNLFNRKVIQGLFKRLGLEIGLAENGIEAVKMVGEYPYDIVFMDLLMPEMDGLQAIAEMRKQGFKAPVIALTAVESDDSRRDALKAGFDDYLIKPASEDKLRKIILEASSKTKKS